MTEPLRPAYLDALGAAADQAARAEEDFRRSIATRTKELERERAFAFRRVNLVRALAEVVAHAGDEATAAAVAASVLRTRLGWSTDSDARSEVVEKFRPVARAMFDQHTREELDREPADVGVALAEFEAWYAATHPVAFWMLFENVMPETPVVDF